MKQEDKELLLKDLCARLPYGVCVHIRYKEGEPCYGRLTPRDIQWFIDSNIENIKPYLRPIPSMTEEEREELSKVVSFSLDNFEEEDDEPSEWFLYDKTGIKNLMGGARFYFDEMAEVYDWLLAHHFDYRGLIEKGLALEAPSDMYK